MEQPVVSEALPIRNLMANAAGTLWMAGLTIAVVPLFLHILGPSSYGLIGFHTSLQAFVLILDLGLGTTINREIARLAVQPEGRDGIRPLLRRMEVAYWGGAVVIVSTLLLCCPLLARHWFHSSQLDQAAIQSSLQWMAVVIALQFPFALYVGVLLGLQRHVVFNFVLVGGSALRLAGAIPVILLFPTATAFFKWQVLATAVQTAGCAILARRAAGPLRSRPSADLFRQVGTFAVPMTVISLLASGGTQMDRLIMSRVVSLEVFATYALGATLATGVLALAVPVHMSVFPRLSSLVSAGDGASADRVYSWGLRLVVAIVAPVCAVLACFPREVLFAWTHDSLMASQGGGILRFLVIGSALAALLQLPFCLQLAHGMTGLPLIQNALYVMVGAPLFFLVGSAAGAQACAMSVAILQLVMVAVVLPLTNARLRPGRHLREWFDVSLIALAGALPPLLLQVVLPAAPTPAGSALHVLMAGAAAAALSLAAALVISGRGFWRAQGKPA